MRTKYILTKHIRQDNGEVFAISLKTILTENGSFQHETARCEKWAKIFLDEIKGLNYTLSTNVEDIKFKTNNLSHLI